MKTDNSIKVVPVHEPYPTMSVTSTSTTTTDTFSVPHEVIDATEFSIMIIQNAFPEWDIAWTMENEWRTLLEITVNEENISDVDDYVLSVIAEVYKEKGILINYVIYRREEEEVGRIYDNGSPSEDTGREAQNT